MKKYLPKIAGFATVALIGFIAVSHGVLNNKLSVPRIDSISPAQGPDGTVITLIGSGFTTDTDNISQNKKDNGENTLPPGNYLKIEGKIIGMGVFSTDGTTLKYKLDLSETKNAKECTKKLNKKEDCEIGLKVVNSYGKESNEVHFLVTPTVAVNPDQLFTPVSVWSAILWPGAGIPLNFQYYVLFKFDTNTLPNVQAFKVYQKILGASSFSPVATFSNPSSLMPPDTNSCSTSTTSGQWQLKLCPGGNWYATSNFLPLSSYPNGRYDFYVTAIDSTGTERTASAIMTTYILGRATVTSPIANGVTTAIPTITYNLSKGWPLGVSYEVHVYDATTGAYVKFFSRSVDPTTQTQDSFLYSDTSSSFDNTALTPGKTYYVEARVSQTPAGNSTYEALPDGVYFTVGN